MNHFVPSYYDTECCQKLQQLPQGNKLVEDYQKELEISMKRANVNEGEEVKMARFLYGLRQDISKIVELYGYRGYQDLVHYAI